MAGRYNPFSRTWYPSNYNFAIGISSEHKDLSGIWYWSEGGLDYEATLVYVGYAQEHPDQYIYTLVKEPI